MHLAYIRRQGLSIIINVNNVGWSSTLKMKIHCYLQMIISTQHYTRQKESYRHPKVAIYQIHHDLQYYEDSYSISLLLGYLYAEIKYHLWIITLYLNSF
jgi:hypothetical protein